MAKLVTAAEIRQIWWEAVQSTTTKTAVDDNGCCPNCGYYENQPGYNFCGLCGRCLVPEEKVTAGLLNSDRLIQIPYVTL